MAVRGAPVEFRNVAKSYGAVAALVDFTLAIEAGEFLTLLGPSGSGKTTALNVLAGFVPPSQGEILIDGRSIASLPTEKRNIGMVFQNYSLFPHMTVADNVAFPLRMRRVNRHEARRKVERALALVRLGGFEERMPKQLSGGQQQRVAFARAIVFGPKVLLMDEPLGALDLKLREAMQIEIKHYQEEIGCTVIYVTHDQGEALTLSDRIAVMNRGRIVQVGRPDEIYDCPQTRFVAEFIGQTNVLEARAENGAAGAELVVHDAGVRLPRPPGLDVAPGGTCHLSLRPEKVVRADPDANGLVTFDAVVVEAVFLGDVVRYSVRLPSGKEMLFKEPRGSGPKALGRGESVRLAFAPDDAVALAGAEDA